VTQTRPANISTLTAGGISPDVAQLLQGLPPDMRANAIAQIANNQRLEAELTKKQNEQKRSGPGHVEGEPAEIFRYR